MCKFRICPSHTCVFAGALLRKCPSCEEVPNLSEYVIEIFNSTLLLLDIKDL